jgi:hypothetical protein
MSRVQTVVGTFWSPVAALARAAEARFFVLPLLLWTLVTVGVTFVLAPRLDIDAATSAALEKSPEPMSPHQKEEAIAMGHKIGLVSQYAGSLFVPTLFALGVAFIFWLALKVAGGTPAFSETFAVVSHAGLPLAVKGLLTLPAILRTTRIPVTDVDKLLPSNLNSLLADRFHGNAASLAASLDIFTLWVLALLVIGLARVAGVTRLRAAVTTVILWGAYIGVFQIALKSLIPGARS